MTNPHEFIPILFTLRNQVDNHFYQINSRTDHPETNKYLVQTQSQAKSSGIIIPKIHGAKKVLDLNVKPGKQRPLPSIPTHNVDKGPPTHPIPKPRIGQGRARLRRKDKTHKSNIITPADTCSANGISSSKSSTAINTCL